MKHLYKILLCFSLALMVNRLFGDSLNIRKVSETNYRAPRSICYASIAGHSYALIGLEPGFKVLNVDDPTRPFIVSSLNTPDYVCDVEYNNGYAYLAERGLNYFGGVYTNGAFRVIDVSNPENPSEVGALTTPGSAQEIKIAGTTAFIADLGWPIRVIDISNPPVPIEIDSIQSYDWLWGIDVRDTLAYIMSEFGLQIVNISNIHNPFEVSYCPMLGYCRKVLIAGQYAYIVRTSGIVTADVTNPISPIKLDSLSTLDSGVDLKKNGNLLYMADDNLRIVSVTDPANISYLGTCSTGDNTRSLDIHDTLVYAASWPNHVNIINVKDSSAPRIIGHYDTKNGPYGLTINGNYLYGMGWAGGVRVYDISVPSDPKEIGTLDSGYVYNGYGIEVRDTIGYVAAEGLRVVNVANQKRIFEVGHCVDLYYANSVAVSGDRAYLANGPYLSIMNINDSQNPTLTGHIELQSGTNGIKVEGNYAYVPLDSSGLKIVDVSNPTIPTEVGCYPSDNKVSDVAVKDTFAYVTNDTAGLVVLNVNDKGHPSKINQFHTRGRGDKLFLDSNRLYITGDTLQVVDISNALSIAELGYYPMGGDCVVRKGGYLYLSHAGGLTVLQEYGPLGVCNIRTPRGKTDLNIQVRYYNNALHYTLPINATVRNDLYNMLGQKVKTLENGYKQQGHYALNLGNMTSGIYFVKTSINDVRLVSRFAVVH